MRTRMVRLGVLCAVLAVLLVVFSQLSLVNAGLPCPVYMLTGFYCPGCGTGRAVGSLLRLDLAAALGYNAVSVVFLPPLAVLLGAQALRYVQGKQVAYKRGELYLAIGIIAVFLLFGILRNLPAFRFLAPA